MSIRPYAILDNSGTCVNCCSWDGVAQWSPPAGCTAVDISAVNPQPSIGWTYIGGVWAAPSPPPTPGPASVSRVQALAALTHAGLYATAQAAVTAAGGITLLAWNNATQFDRTSPTIASLQGALGLTSAQVDALFIAAAQITA